MLNWQLKETKMDHIFVCKLELISFTTGNVSCYRLSCRRDTSEKSNLSSSNLLTRTLVGQSSRSDPGYEECSFFTSVESSTYSECIVMFL